MPPVEEPLYVFCGEFNNVTSFSVVAEPKLNLVIRDNTLNKTYLVLINRGTEWSVKSPAQKNIELAEILNTNNIACTAAEFGIRFQVITQGA